MKVGLVLLSLAVLLCATAAFSAASATIASPQSPARGTVTISFTVTATDSNNLAADLLYTQNDANTQIVAGYNLLNEFNNPANNAAFDCGSAAAPARSNPDANTYSCTYSWDAGSINANGIRVVVRGFTEGSAEKAEAQTAPITIDNSAPAVAFIQPNDSNKAAYESNFISFDVNDTLSQVSAIAVDFQGLGNESFSFASHCTARDTNFHCEYRENVVAINNENYTFSVNAADAAGNLLSASNSTTFRYIDNTAPAQVGTLTATAGDAQASLSWPASSAYDLNAYFIYMSTTNNFTADSSTYTGSATANSFVKTGLSNGTTYYFRVKAGDRSGNMGALSEQASATPAASSNVPARPDINSSTHPDESKWVGSSSPQFTWAGVANASKYRYAFNQTSDTTPDSANETTELSKSYSGMADGEYYFHLRACNSANECSAADHYKVRVDTTNPGPVANILGLSQSDGSIYLSWEAPSDNSGIGQYTLFRSIDQKVNDRDFLPSDVGVKRIEGIAETHFTDDGLTKGIAYYYRIQGIDNAGNSGSMSAVKKVLNSGSACSLTITSGLPAYTQPKAVQFTISLGGGEIMNATLKAKTADGKESTLAEGLKGASITKSLDLSFSQDGNVTLTLRGKDSRGSACEKQFDITVDSQKPQAELRTPAEGEKVFGIVKVLAAVSDDGSGIAKITAMIDGNKVSESDNFSGGNYEFEFNSAGYTNSGHTIDIEATDRAGNQQAASRRIVIGNGGATREKEYSYNESELIALIDRAGIAQDMLEQAEQLTLSAKPQRKLLITGSEAGFGARIEIILQNIPEGDFEIIEVIPKAIASKASAITSETPFTVLQDDPVIKFSPARPAEGSALTITYAVGSALTQEQAESLEESLGTFIAPPILVNAGANPMREAANDGTDLLLAIAGAVVVLLIAGAAAGGAALFVLSKKPHTKHHGFSGPAQPTRTEEKKMRPENRGRFKFSGK